MQYHIECYFTADCKCGHSAEYFRWQMKQGWSCAFHWISPDVWSIHRPLVHQIKVGLLTALITMWSKWIYHSPTLTKRWKLLQWYRNYICQTSPQELCHWCLRTNPTAPITIILRKYWERVSRGIHHLCWRYFTQQIPCSVLLYNTTQSLLLCVAMYVRYTFHGLAIFQSICLTTGSNVEVFQLNSSIWSRHCRLDEWKYDERYLIATFHFQLAYYLTQSL